MTSRTAAFDDARRFNGRNVSLGDNRRIARHLLGGVAAVAGTVVAVGAAVTIVTVTASWFVNTALVTHPDYRTTTPFGPAAVAFAGGDSASADGGTFARSARLSLAYASPLSFEAKWARTMALAAGTVPPAPADPFDGTTDWASLQPAPQGFPPSGIDADIGGAKAPKVVAELTPAAPPAPALPRPAARPPAPPREEAESVPLPRANPAPREAPQLQARRPAPRVAVLAPPAPATVTPRHAPSMTLPDADSRTAVYDISAHTVYLPNGERLEAHSGLGDKLDDPRYISAKNRGPTPPNVYELTLREQLFHEVRAIRLTPVDGSRMFGRDGMLAHTYMLGPNGQSNGCVSFKDYQAFLRAFLRGDVKRLVVVPHLGDKSWRTADAGHGPASWFADIFR